jgi:orotidine-5'-phosphate decarboxylase
MSGFYKLLSNSWEQKNSLLCVGLDPEVARLPKHIAKHKVPLFLFNREIIDATAQWVCAFKPQAAYYSAIGAEKQLEKTIHYIKSEHPNIPVILDAKRGDIGATARMYAIEAFERYQADAVTVNPYMGGDTIKPFLEYRDRGVIVLCRTSNPGSGELQQLQSAGRFIYEHVANLAYSEWNQNNNIGLVVGATYPEVIANVRKIVGEMPLLIPGIGAQGGEIDSVVKNGLSAAGAGLVVNVSRSIIFASQGTEFGTAASEQAKNVCLEINQSRSV